MQKLKKSFRLLHLLAGLAALVGFASASIATPIHETNHYGEHLANAANPHARLDSGTCFVCDSTPVHSPLPAIIVDLTHFAAAARLAELGDRTRPYVPPIFFSFARGPPARG